MSIALRSLQTARSVLPPSARRAVRRAIDPVLAPVGSLAGVHVGVEGAAPVGLTFDDGPDPSSTPLVLAALAHAGVSATFFMLTERAERHRPLVKEIVAAGHEVGLHGPDHQRLTSLGASAVQHRLVGARHLLEDLTQNPVRWFRPPFGSQSLSTYVAIRRAGLAPVVWSAEGEDWVSQPPSCVAARVMAPLRPGGIVLLHDALAGDPREPSKPDPLRDIRGDVAAAVLNGLVARDLKGTTIGNLVAQGRPHLTAWFRP